MLFRTGRFDLAKRWLRAVEAAALLKREGYTGAFPLSCGIEPHGSHVIAHARHLGLTVVDVRGSPSSPLLRYFAGDIRYIVLLRKIDNVVAFRGTKSTFHSFDLEDRLTSELRQVDGIRPADATEEGVVRNLYERTYRGLDDYFCSLFVSDAVRLLVLGDSLVVDLYRRGPRYPNRRRRPVAEPSCGVYLALEACSDASGRKPGDSPTRLG